MSFIDTSAITDLATSPYALIVLGSLSFSESAFFIIPPEVLLIPMALLYPELALIYGIVTTITSVAGAAFGYVMGRKGGQPILKRFFSTEKINTVKKLFQQYGIKAIFISAFTPIPFKVFTVAAGVFDLNFYKFIITSLLGRGARYMLLSGMIMVYGDSIRNFLEHQLDKAVAIGTVVGIGGFFIYKFGLSYIEKNFLKMTLKEKFSSLFKRS
jgi:membrane protein YqaA with SNARE-associated domain